MSTCKFQRYLTCLDKSFMLIRCHVTALVTSLNSTACAHGVHTLLVMTSHMALMSARHTSVIGTAQFDQQQSDLRRAVSKCECTELGVRSTNSPATTFHDLPTIITTKRWLSLLNSGSRRLALRCGDIPWSEVWMDVIVLAVFAADRQYQFLTHLRL